jgi:hypothetical protein
MIGARETLRQLVLTKHHCRAATSAGHNAAAEIETAIRLLDEADTVLSRLLKTTDSADPNREFINDARKLLR